ncbi:MAG: hypothetical protein AB7F35_00725 [Acetobacteraceae bacterium]
MEPTPPTFADLLQAELRRYPCFTETSSDGAAITAGNADKTIRIPLTGSLLKPHMIPLLAQRRAHAAASMMGTG